MSCINSDCGQKKRQGLTANVYLGPPRTTFAILSVASVCVADFAKPSSPAELDMAFTVGHDRIPAHGSAAMAPAMTSNNTGISNCSGRRSARREACSALRGVRPLPQSWPPTRRETRQRVADFVGDPDASGLVAPNKLSVLVIGHCVYQSGSCILAARRGILWGP